MCTAWLINETFTRALYKRAETLPELIPFKGSKYIMSEADPQIYPQVKADLAKGRKVLFVGCPCEVDALKCYLGEDDKNLITCDLICHGATSPLALSQYVERVQAAAGSRAISCTIRAKKDGTWIPYYIYLGFEDGGAYMAPLGETDVNAAFNNLKRPSCHQCHFKHPHSAADFTAGDHLGINKEDAGYHPAGVSVIFVHSEKGASFIRGLRGFSLREETYEKAAGIQRALDASIDKSIYYSDFRRILLQEGLASAAQYVRDAKAKAFHDIITSAAQCADAENGPFDCVIWGVGQHFELTYETILACIPNARIVAVVDKYKTGERHGVHIIQGAQLAQIGFDHVFITTISGRHEAVDTLKLILGEGAEQHYTISIPS